MRNAKSWSVFLFLCLMIGISIRARAQTEVEIKIMQLQEGKEEVNLYFPLSCDENEIFFSETDEQMTLLQEKVIEMMHSGINEEEFLKKTEGDVLEQTITQLMCYHNLNQWIQCLTPKTFFEEDFFLDPFCIEPDLPFKRIELGEEKPYLSLIYNEGTDHFYALRLTDNDCHNISKLIKNMADLNLWDLLKKSKEMKKLGQKIEPIHPFRFLGFIFSTHDLKTRMTKIKANHFKWSKFMEGLADRLTKEANQNNLHCYVPGFVEIVGCSSSIIEDYILYHDWNGLLDYLM